MNASFPLAPACRTLRARRDVKPENLLCSRRDGFDRVKLADFGSAMLLPPEGCAAVDPVAQGTTLYSPPEVLLGKTYSYAADMWASGITTYVLISGNFPFGSTADALSSSASFEGDAWAGASRPREFISSLLLHEPTMRPTALQARRHPWLSVRPRVEPPHAPALPQQRLVPPPHRQHQQPPPPPLRLRQQQPPLLQHSAPPPPLAPPPLAPMLTPAVPPTLPTEVALVLVPPPALSLSPSDEAALPAAGGLGGNGCPPSSTSPSPPPPASSETASPRTPPTHASTSDVPHALGQHDSPIKRVRLQPNSLGQDAPLPNQLSHPSHRSPHGPAALPAGAAAAAAPTGAAAPPPPHRPPPPPATKRRCLRASGAFEPPPTLGGWRAPEWASAAAEEPIGVRCPRLLTGLLPSPLHVLDNHHHALLQPAGDGGRAT